MKNQISPSYFIAGELPRCTIKRNMMIKKIVMLFLCMSTAQAMEPAEVARKEAFARLRNLKNTYYPALTLENPPEELKAYGLFMVLQKKSLAEYPTTFAKAVRFCEGSLVNHPSPDIRVRYSTVIKRLCNEVMQMAYRNDLQESDFDHTLHNCITTISASRPLMNAIIGVDTQMTIAQIQQEFDQLAITVNNSTSASEKIWHH